MAACAAGTAGLAAAGTLYGALAAGVRVARRCCRFCSCPWWPRSSWPGRGPGRWRSGPARGDAADPWLRLLLVFAAVYLALGVVIFGPLQEAS